MINGKWKHIGLILLVLICSVFQVTNIQAEDNIGWNWTVIRDGQDYSREFTISIDDNNVATITYEGWRKDPDPVDVQIVNQHEIADLVT